MSLAQKVLRHILVFPGSHTSSFILLSLTVSPRRLFPVLTCCLCVDMSFNNDKKKKLADLLAKRRAAAVGEGTSTPVAPSTSATSAPQPINPAPAAVERRGVMVVESDDKEMCTGLVFKRPRVGKTATPS